MSNKTRWFWLLSDGKTVKEITRKKASELNRKTMHSYGKIHYRMLSIHQSEIGLQHIPFFTKAQMIQLIPILSEWCFA